MRGHYNLNTTDYAYTQIRSNNNNVTSVNEELMLHMKLKIIANIQKKIYPLLITMPLMQK